jgi:hypothetical protein
MAFINDEEQMKNLRCIEIGIFADDEETIPFEDEEELEEEDDEGDEEEDDNEEDEEDDDL